jgi:dipeptidyl aminopeptidase/acylaminoacyl peptidase
LHGWFIPAQSQTLHGRDARATDPTSILAPTVLHVHGNAGNIAHHIGFTDYLPAAGFNLFIFDYRGYGQSEGKATSRGPLIADTNAALDALLARADIDPQRIAIYGQSLGGSIALNVMAERPEVRAAVIESAFTSWRDIAANAVGGKNPNIIFRSLAAVLIPDTHRADDAIAKIKRPLLLLHGDADSIIPVEHSRKLAAAAGTDSDGHIWATLVELSGGDHNTLRDTHPEVESIVIDFLRERLGKNIGTTIEHE